MLFVPAGVGVMVYFDLIAQQWLPLVLATAVSTAAVIAVTGLTANFLLRKGGAHEVVACCHPPCLELP